MVMSESRSDVGHLVDLEGFDGSNIYCSCEAFFFGGRKPCKHIKLIEYAVKNKTLRA